MDDDIKQVVMISIPALREEGDAQPSALGSATRTFLSPPSARRATQDERRRPQGDGISIPALREEGDALIPDDGLDVSISIPALREEGDHPAPRARAHQDNFYPRPPRGGRHKPLDGPVRHDGISIPALREEGDRCRSTLSSYACIFLSPPSARRATQDDLLRHLHEGISIPALREEGDSKNRDKISIFKQIIQHSARI